MNISIKPPSFRLNSVLISPFLHISFSRTVHPHLRLCIFSQIHLMIVASAFYFDIESGWRYGLASLIHQYWNEEDAIFGNRIRERFKQDFLETSQIRTLEIISGQPQKNRWAKRIDFEARYMLINDLVVGYIGDGGKRLFLFEDFLRFEIKLGTFVDIEVLNCCLKQSVKGLIAPS